MVGTKKRSAPDLGPDDHDDTEARRFSEGRFDGRNRELSCEPNPKFWASVLEALDFQKATQRS